MTEFTNPSYIMPAITDITCPMPGQMKDLPTIENFVYGTVGYDKLGLVIENIITAEVIQESN